MSVYTLIYAQTKYIIRTINKYLIINILFDTNIKLFIIDIILNYMITLNYDN